jgi:hypothetical protein
MVAAVVLLLRVEVEGRIRRPGAAAAGVRAELFTGFGVLAGDANARVIVGLMTTQAFVRGCLNVLIVVTAFRVLDAGGGAVGYMTAALGVGGLLGAFAR